MKKLLFVLTCLFAMRLGAKIVVAKGKKNAPVIVQDAQGKLDGCSNYERISPCYGRSLTVLNPTFSRLTVIFDCGPDILSTIEVDIYPRTKTTVEISSDQLGSMQKGQCFIKGWRTK